ncbi:hypothetical protein EQO05_12830 [Methanosarcina sp. MSH10X1]|uniref:hypothetical protein n=1 Tax=Methanosarcina sp. MSH10X1 TaxID=2507075 RepID=UPI000FFB9DE0|nr:hypothetical protein [Methanosarcina sp. MSH10X1]RXA17082.1 hypothetical protein EQO05_12830 [Methanosarcina sp. MSH10X1]
MKKSYAILFALVVLISTTVSVQALQSKTIERHNGASAYANWYETNGDMTTYTYLSVGESDYGTDISVSTTTYGPDFYSEKYGYLFTEDDVFKASKKLNSASLSGVKVDVCDYYTGEAETLTIQADWTGEGDVSTGSSTSGSRDGNYKFKSSDSSSYRLASATGSMNGYDLGESSDASLSNFKSAYMSMQK